MDLSPTDEQRHLGEALDQLLASLSDPEQVRAAESTNGFSPELFDRLTEMGIWAMGLPEAVGGMDAALADLAVAVGACGAHAAPVPVVETLVAGAVLAATAPEDPRLHGLVAGTTIVVFAPRAGTGSTATVVPGGAIADAVITYGNDELVIVDGPGRRGTPFPNTAHGPLADIPVGPDAPGRTVLATGADARARFDAAQDQWRALTAVWLAGLGRAALDLGVDYAKERRQFDVPIGSFQAVAHPLADVACDLDGADLLAAKAVWALDENEPIASRFASSAFFFAGDTAERATRVALHTHGGYGFMDEYDIQLLFRRAKSTRLLLGDPRRELQTLADRFIPVDADGRPDDLPATSVPAMTPAAEVGEVTHRGPDFRLGAEVEAFRDEVAAFLEEHVTDTVIETAHETGTIHDWGLHRAMAEQGWISAGWPKEYGGGGRSPLEMNVLSEQMYLSGAPVDGIGVASLVAHTILLEGTEWQKTTIVPEILSGETICALGYSEPESGSDVAAAATRAVRDGDRWVINGSKMFTTLAHEAGYVFLLTRTNTEVPKHKGLTMFIVPIDTPGISMSPVHTMGGERTNITYYDDVVVDDRFRVGDVDGGWGVMMTALVFERNAAWYGEAVRLLDHAIGWAAATPAPGGGTMLADPLVRERLARAAIGNEVANLLGWRAAWLASIGTLPNVEGTMAKLFTTEHYQRAASDLTDLLGADGVRRHGDPAAPADGWIEALERHSQVTTIYGGTSEVLRGIIAQRGLGLPRAG